MSDTTSSPGTMRGGADKALNCVSGKAANDYVWALKDGGKMVDLPVQ